MIDQRSRTPLTAWINVLVGQQSARQSGKGAGVGYHVKFTTAGDDYEAVLDRAEAIAWLSLVKWPGVDRIGFGSRSLGDLANDELAVALAAGTASWLETRTDPFVRVETPTVDHAGVAAIRAPAITGIRVWWSDRDMDDEADDEAEDGSTSELPSELTLPRAPWIQ